MCVCGIDLPHRVPPPPPASDREEGGGEQSRVPEAREGKPLEGASTIYCVGSEVSHPPLVAVMRVQYLKVIITSNTLLFKTWRWVTWVLIACWSSPYSAKIDQSESCSQPCTVSAN